MDSTVQFALLGITMLGDTLEMAATWSLHGLDGEIDEAGLFAPLHVGAGIVTADAGAGHESTTVAVVAGAPAALFFSGDTALVAGDERSTCEAR